MSTIFSVSCMQMPSKDRFVSIPEEFAISYCPNAEFERIWRPVMNRAPYLICGFIFMIGILGYFNLLDPIILFLGHLLLAPLKPLLQAAPNPAIAGTIDLIGKMSIWVYGAAGLYVAHLSIVRAEKPTHIGLTNTGLVFTQLQKPAHGYHWITQSIPWNQIKGISIVRPKGTKSTADYRIRIEHTRGTGVNVRYGDLLIPAQRDVFLHALKLGAPEAAFGNTSADEMFSVFKAAKSTEGFTELWLNELAAPSKREKLTPLTPGMVLQSGEYTITRKLGTGGQGIVYLATRTNKVRGTVETVALKEFVMPVFPDARVRKSVAEKFQAEAQMLSRIDHPQIVKLHDVFVEDHRAYLVMERITGKTLKRLVDDGGRLNERDVIACAQQMCAILQYLHTQDPPVIHRDFTPDNLMLSDENKICLIDFSVAQQIEINITGSVVGKHLYMAPEQFRGKATVSSDIYSFGATLAFLLTGEEPEAIAVSRPSEQIPTISPQLDALVSGCTAIDETKRLTLSQIIELLAKCGAPASAG
ncbi:MAG: serine/threonine protein kinase [Cyanobacteria bacterium SZAS-4]|nr:serine/threonine protein kinase [Cyanobacteria bacterium SZAS-4]